MTTQKFTNPVLRGMAAGLAFVGSFALTQNAAAQEDEVTEAGELEEVIVTAPATGTAIRGVAPVGSATLSMSQEDMLNTTSMDTTSFIRELPQGSGLMQQEELPTGQGGGNVGYAQGVNLRGLGDNATLILFDGHRLVGQGITAQFADPNQLPISAIERVEVVMDAASAVYGSDAIAGVVNFVLRDDFEGLELNARTTNSLYDANAIDLLGGFSWDSGNAWLGVLYEDRGTFLRGERDYLMEDLRAYGGNDNRQQANGEWRPGTLPHIVANGTVYGVPATGGRLPTADEILANDGNYTISDLGNERAYWPERERLAVSFRARQEFAGGRGNVTLTGVYSERDSEIVEFSNYEQMRVTRRSPYWIDGLTNASSYNMAYSFFLNNEGANAVDTATRPVEQALNTYLDVVYDLNDNWQLSANYTYGDNETCGRCGKRQSLSMPGAGLTTYADLFNPFEQGIQSDFYDLVYYGTIDQAAWFQMDRASLKFEGGIFDMAGGQARLAFGAEYEATEHRFLNHGTNPRSASNPPAYWVVRDTSSDRDVTAAFVEAYLPVADTVTVNLAVRHDDYSDFGTTTNPRLGISFEPTDSWTFRATVAEAFRAPTLVERDPGVLQQFRRSNYANDGSHDIPITDPRRGTTRVMFKIGNTLGLQPETAEMWTAGFDYAPDGAEGFRVSATYYDVDYRNRIERLPNETAALSNSTNRALYAPFVTAAPQPDTCVPGDFSTYNPVYQNFVDNEADLRGSPASDCALEAIILSGLRNTSAVVQSGLDLQVSYDWSTPSGEWGVRLNGAKVLDLQRAFIPGAALVEQLDRIGFQNSTRMSARLIWRNSRWFASVDATMVGSYINDQPITVNGVSLGDTGVPSWTTLGLNVAYEVPLGEGSGVMNGMRLGLSVDNLTDRDPPIVLTDNRAVDYNNHNVFGRIWSLTLQKRFGGG